MARKVETVVAKMINGITLRTYNKIGQKNQWQKLDQKVKSRLCGETDI